MPLLTASLAPVFASFLGEFNVQTLFAVGSTCITVYFWLIKMNRERAGLKLYRVADFRPDRLQCSDKPSKEKATWYGEIYLANPSTLPIAVVRFQAQLLWRGRWIDGRMVMERKDDVPWMVEPLRVLARGFGCASTWRRGRPASSCSSRTSCASPGPRWTAGTGARRSRPA